MKEESSRRWAAICADSEEAAEKELCCLVGLGVGNEKEDQGAVEGVFRFEADGEI